MKAKKTMAVGLILMLAAAAAMADVRVDSVSLEPAHIEPGDEVDVYVKVYKASEKQDVYGGTKSGGSKGIVRDDPNIFHQAKLVPKNDAAKEYIIILDGSKNIGHLFYGESWTTPFKIKVRADAPKADYKLEYRLIETDPDYSPTGDVKSYDFTVPVQGTVKFSITADADLAVGGTGTLDVTAQNIGGGNARQVSVNLNASSPFTILSSSEAYAGNMIGVSKKDLSYRISVKSDATPGAYEIPTIIKYVDTSGSEVTVKKTIGVEVAGEPEISIMLDSADTLKRGSKGTVNLDIINNGFIDAKFMTIEVIPSQGYTVEEPSKVYIGNLASDDFEGQEFVIRVSEDAPEGMIPLRAVVEYRRENSNQVERVDATINVDVLTDKEYAETVKSNGGGTSTLSMILALPALVILYTVLWLVYKFIGVVTNYLNKRLFKRGVE